MVEPLTVGISTWVVWCGCRLFISIHGVQMLQNSILKRSAFVTMNSSWNSVDLETLVHYYFCHGKGLLIWCYKCLAEFGKGISQDKNIFHVTPWWIHGGKIHTKKVQWSISYDGTRLCLRTYIRTFGYLTLWTIFNIFSYIFIHSAPIEVLSAQGSGSPYTLMTLAIM